MSVYVRFWPFNGESSCDEENAAVRLRVLIGDKNDV